MPFLTTNQENTMQVLNDTEVEAVSGAGFWQDAGYAFGSIFRQSNDAVSKWPAGQEYLYTL